MRQQYVGKKIVVRTKSGKELKGVLKRALKEEVVIATKDGEESLYKDCVELWRPAKGGVIEDGSFYVVRCSRESPKCFGRVAFTEAVKGSEKRVACDSFDRKSCAVVAASFYEMDEASHKELLGQFRLDHRTRQQKSRLKMEEDE